MKPVVVSTFLVTLALCAAGAIHSAEPGENYGSGAGAEGRAHGSRKEQTQEQQKKGMCDITKGNCRKPQKDNAPSKEAAGDKGATGKERGANPAEQAK